MNIEPGLIEGCLKGDRKSEYALYKATFSYLMSICVRYTRQQERAREVLNIGFYKALTNLSSYKQTEPFKPWIRKIMINTLINEYKKEKVHHNNISYVETYYDDSSYAQLNGGIQKMDADQIYGFIAKLPSATQHVFNLYFIDGYRHREIADMLGISEGTSKWHLNAAREKLKDMITKHAMELKTANNE